VPAPREKVRNRSRFPYSGAAVASRAPASKPAPLNAGRPRSPWSRPPRGPRRAALSRCPLRQATVAPPFAWNLHRRAW